MVVERIPHHLLKLDLSEELKKPSSVEVGFIITINIMRKNVS